MTPNTLQLVTPGGAPVRNLPLSPGVAGVGHFTRMRRIVAILTLVMSVFLAGCHKPQVDFTDMHPTPTATVSNNAVTVHLGWAWRTSADYVHAKSKIKDQTVYVYGYYTMKEPSPEYIIKMPASVSTQAISVVWLNPDSSTVQIPFTK
jgi:hypothetical protein